MVAPCPADYMIRNVSQRVVNLIVGTACLSNEWDGVEPHDQYSRHGDDLLTMTTISYRQAVLGDSIEIPTLGGSTVSLKIPAGTQPGTRLRLRNQGLPRLDGYGKGHTYVQIQVQVPTKISGEQEELLRKFDELDEASGKRKKKSIVERVKDIFH